MRGRIKLVFWFMCFLLYHHRRPEPRAMFLLFSPSYFILCKAFVVVYFKCFTSGSNGFAYEKSAFVEKLMIVLGRACVNPEIFVVTRLKGTIN